MSYLDGSDLFITSRLLSEQGHCKKAKLQARIKPTTLCLVIDKENSIKFLLDFSILLIQLLHGLCTSFPCLSYDIM